MTAEITIMNREAVALAADSAVTARLPGGQKIFASGSKLYALSYEKPLGLMVYNNSIFMEIPWETIIKTYRKYIVSVGYDTVDQYADDFISFIEKDNDLFPPDARIRFFESFIAGYLETVKTDIEKKVEAKISEKGGINDKISEKTVNGVIDDHIKKWGKSLPGSLKIDSCRSVIKSNEAELDKILKQVFKKLPMSAKTREGFFELASLVLSIGTRMEYNSGIVIAGFGEKEYFPSMVDFTVDGLINKSLKLYGRRISSISKAHLSIITPFAQREMVDRFMGGVDPVYKSTERGYIKELCKAYALKVVESLDINDSDVKSKTEAELLQIGQTLFNDYERRMDNFVKEQFVNPIANVVSIMQKSELALLAESLVTLTSQKRQFSAEEETVKGPVDVAVISKGDGFIWIKRKHYFQPEINPHFNSVRRERWEYEQKES